MRTPAYEKKIAAEHEFWQREFTKLGNFVQEDTAHKDRMINELFASVRNLRITCGFLAVAVLALVWKAVAQ